MHKLVSAFSQNRTDEVRVQLIELKGQDCVDIRVFTALREGQDKIPTGKGLSVNLSHFNDLKRSIAELENVLKENHLLP